MGNINFRKEVKQYFKEYWDSKKDISKGILTSSGLNLIVAISKFFLFLIILSLTGAIFIILFVKFYINEYQKQFIPTGHHCWKEGRPLRPIIINQDSPITLWFSYCLGRRVKTFFIIMRDVIEYNVEFPELPDNLKLLDFDKRDVEKFKIIKGDMTNSSILEEQIGVNLTSARNYGVSRLEIYYLIKNDLRNFKKKMKIFVDEELISQ